MAEQDDSDKTEEPTLKRLEDARKEGQVARSREFGGAAILGLSVLTLYVGGSQFAGGSAQWLRNALQFRREDIMSAQPLVRTAALMIDLGTVFLPLIVVGVLAGALAPLVLGGFSFSMKAVSPKLSKLNPIEGLQRLISTRSLIETLKSVVRVSLVIAVGWFTLRGQMDELASLLAEPLPRAMAHGGLMALQLLLNLTIVLVLIAAVDAPIQLWQHRKQLMMTRQQVRDEFKESEGNPELKARVRRLQQEVANRRMMEAVPSADVVLVNPTHYAVALKYEAGRMNAPTVVARGVDELALRIRQVADGNRVTIVSAPPLARALYRESQLGKEIPVRLYAAVAQVLSYVYQLRAWRAGTAPASPELGEVAVDEFAPGQGDRR